ncbi:MAG: triosephosphate isomerase [Fimbriimonadales bacterium]|nr:MAG: triosephosphate isomerase [Fimbriimonadales bacterium]
MRTDRARRLIVGNWKMNLDQAGARHLAAAIATAAKAETHFSNIVICPPYTLLHAAKEAVAGSTIRLGAQDVFWEEKGAFTGKISPGMLVDAGVDYCIVGHSECRGRFGAGAVEPRLARYFADDDETVRLKFSALLKHGIKPILCVGETEQERKEGRADQVVHDQVSRVIVALAEDATGAAVAYEPVWAIGTGQVCDPEEAARMAARIREILDRCRQTGIRVLYGGSVTPENAEALFAHEEIQGALVGGASLRVDSFTTIVRYAG